MPTEHIKVYQERPRLSVWLWIVPFLFLILFLTFFFMRRRTHPVSRAMAQPTVSTLPDLGSLSFEPGRPVLAEDGQATLDRAAEAMRGNPNVLLRVEGYADGKPHSPRGDSLSQQRALSIARYLEAKGIDRSRLTGGSETVFKPLGSNSLQPEKGDMRRVELYIQ